MPLRRYEEWKIYLALTDQEAAEAQRRETLKRR
jgi:hypothetical protein